MMSIDCGSPAVVRSAMPPLQSLWEVWNLATGSGCASRSTTSMALALSAPCTARLNARAARETSREVVTTAPFFRVVAYALTNRTHSSGVISTLTRPETPRGPNSVRCPRDSQMTLVLTTAPASIVLNGYTRTPAETYASDSMTHSSPTIAASSILADAITSVFLPITQPRRVAPTPTYTLLWTMARCRNAPSFTTTLFPITVNSRSWAPASILA